MEISSRQCIVIRSHIIYAEVPLKIVGPDAGVAPQDISELYGWPRISQRIYAGGNKLRPARPPASISQCSDEIIDVRVWTLVRFNSLQGRHTIRGREQ